MPWIDILFIVILVIFALVGLAKGFLKSLVALFSTLITLVLAIWISKPVSGLVDSLFGLSTIFGDMLEGGIYNSFQGGIPVAFQGLVNVLMGADYMATNPDTTSIEFASDFADKLGNIITIAICVVVLYFLIRFILYLLSRLFDVITQNKAVDGLDRVLGFLLGAVKGAVMLFVCFGIIYIVSTLLPSVGGSIEYYIEMNPICQSFYNWTRDIVENTLLPFFFG